MSMEHRSNDTDKGYPKHSEKTLSEQLSFIHHKSQVLWPGIEPIGWHLRPITNCLSHNSMAQEYYTICSNGRRPSYNHRQ